MNQFHKVTTETITYIKKASTARKVELYYKLHIKYRVASQNVWFNQMCKKLKVWPNYIHLTTRTTGGQATTAIDTAKKSWLLEETKKWFQIRDNIHLYIKVLHSELSHELHNVYFDLLDDKIREKVSDVIYLKYQKQKRKLTILCDKNKNKNSCKKEYPMNQTNQTTFHKRVENLSNFDFNNKEITLLNKGFKYNPYKYSKKYDLDNLSIDTEIALTKSKQPISTKHIIAQKIKSHQNDRKSETDDLKTLKVIKEKSKTNNLIFTKADKGNTIVILNKEDYNKKVTDFIENNNFTITNKDPTNKYQRTVTQFINNNQYLHKQPEKFKIKIMNPSPPLMYGLPKLHKTDIPIRPVVSFLNSPTYKLAKNLNSQFLKMTNFTPSHTIKNSIELVNKLKNIKLDPNCKLISLDVTNLFTNIPTNELLPIIENILKQHIFDSRHIDEFLDAFDICIQQNYFKFNNKIYESKEGLAMGSPLSPLLSDIYMDFLETKFLKTTNYKNQIQYYFRYVDDILIGWKGTDRQLDIFFKQINSVHPKIQFTLEKEINNSLNYLDLTISRNQTNHEFKIFRKPTHTDTTINAKSTHPLSHKLAAYHSMIHRLFTIPMSEINFNLELNNIIEIAFNNGYEPKIIQNLVKKKSHQIVLESLYPKVKTPQEKIYTSIPYYGKISQTIKNKIKQVNVITTFKTVNNLGKQLINNKDKINIMDKSGVYKLKCNDCDSCYVGQTGRSFKTRIDEHKKSYTTKKTEFSTFAEHLQTMNHTSDFNPDVLHIQNKGFKLNLLEATEIKKTINTAVNEMTDLYNSPLINILVQKTPQQLSIPT